SSFPAYFGSSSSSSSSSVDLFYMPPASFSLAAYQATGYNLPWLNSLEGFRDDQFVVTRCEYISDNQSCAEGQDPDMWLELVSKEHVFVRVRMEFRHWVRDLTVRLPTSL